MHSPTTLPYKLDRINMSSSWGSSFFVIPLIISAIGAETVHHNANHINLRAKLQDHSWNVGRSSLVAVSDNSTCNAIFSCSNCSTARICRPSGSSFVEVKTIPCPANLPFCDYSTGTCSSTPDPSCGRTDDFICLQDGHFPDATLCNTYHVCDNNLAHKFTCNITGENYNPVSQQCEKSTTCTTFTCDSTGRKVPAIPSPYTPASQYQTYYAYCDKSTAAPIVIDKCPGAYQLNVTSQSCETPCDEEGVQQDLTNCQNYFKCSRLWVNDSTSFLVKQSLACPKGTGFDPSQFICVDLNEYPSCKSSVEKKDKHVGGLISGILHL